MAIIASLSELSLWVLLCLSLIPSSASRIALTNRQYDDHKWNEHMKMLAENPHRRMVSKKEKMLSYLNASSLNKINFERHRSLAASSAAGVIAAAIESARQTVIYLPLSLPGTGGVVGDEVLFELMDEPSNPVTGTIRSVTTFGAGRFVWSGSLSRSSRSSGDVDEVSGGTFYVSWVNGAMIGDVYLPVLGMQYEYRPLDRSAGAYSLREVPMAVYDEEGEDDEQPHDMRAYNQMMGIRMGVGVDTIPTTTTTATTTTTGEGDGVGVGSDAAHADHTHRTSGPVEAALEHKSSSKVDTLNTDTNNIVDVMVLYTPEAFVEYGSDQDSMDAFVDLTVSMANDAYENSNIDMRMRLVRGAQILDSSYVESGFSSDLSRLKINGDGYFDSDMVYRTSSRADAVVLIVADGQYCGLGYLWASTSQAFSVISIYCPQSLVHEVGHNVGSEHDRATVGSTDYSRYNFGYCWDTTASTCSRSVMAYSGCVTDNLAQTSCPRDFYFSSPLVRNGALGESTGISTSDNARLHNEQVSRATNWMSAASSDGLLFSARPNSARLGRCEQVLIDGWGIGSGSDIISVTLNGVPVHEIGNQSVNQVVVLVGNVTDESFVGTGDIVVTSAGGITTTLSGGFTFEPSSGAFVTDFESGQATYWTSTGDLSWTYIRYCSQVRPCDNMPVSGPAVGEGGSGAFARASSPVSASVVAEFTAYFNLDNPVCVDTITSISLYYHMWTRYSSCRGSLEIQVLHSAASSAWSTVASASAYQASQDDPWLPLSYTFSDPANLTAIRIRADPFNGGSTCYYWASVAVDSISVARSTSCSQFNCSFVDAEGVDPVYTGTTGNSDSSGDSSNGIGVWSNTILLGVVVLILILIVGLLVLCCYSCCCKSDSSNPPSSQRPQPSQPPSPQQQQQQPPPPPRGSTARRSPSTTPASGATERHLAHNYQDIELQLEHPVAVAEAVPDDAYNDSGYNDRGYNDSGYNDSGHRAARTRAGGEYNAVATAAGTSDY
mmetsp:Transcript_14452/g.24022  ORF Transcript_14452/g.24022 Transcript_14452/m.24022 type:complete len:1003 (+) Transcript_14452:75-3083(+)